MNDSQNTPHILVDAEHVTSHVLMLVGECVEDWFNLGFVPALNEEDFIDRLCAGYLNPEGLDIEDLGTPAVRKIMRHARKVRKEMA